MLPISHKDYLQRKPLVSHGLDRTPRVHHAARGRGCDVAADEVIE